MNPKHDNTQMYWFLVGLQNTNTTQMIYQKIQEELNTRPLCYKTSFVAGK